MVRRDVSAQLLAHLDAKELTDNTLIVFVIDNGWIQETGDKQDDAR